MNAATRRHRRQQLEALIDWHLAQRPAAHVRIPITLTPAKLKQLLGQAPRPGSTTEFLYRGCVLVATGLDQVRARFLGGA